MMNFIDFSVGIDAIQKEKNINRAVLQSNAGELFSVCDYGAT